MKAQFAKLINSSKPVLIDFFADWCQPCHMLAPVLVDVKESLGEQIKIVKVNTEINPNLAAKYQIRGIPTMILFKDGEQVWRQSGVIPKEQILHAIQPHLSNA